MRAPLIDQIEAAGLTGRGGAAFPTATKLRALTDARTAVIVNACDGERGAIKDAWVVAHRLDELRLGADLLDTLAGGPVRYAARRSTNTATLLAASGVDLLEVPDRYVSSEETSLINLAQGGLARPMSKRSLFIRGGRDSTGRKIAPTVVLNAETVWRIAQISEHGPEWFRAQGTRAEPGPRLISVTGQVPRPIVVETQAGVELSRVLDATATPREARHLLINGLSGVFVQASAARAALWSGDGLAALGARLGSGTIEVLDPERCPLDLVSEILTYAAGETAGQCGPCMFGVPELAGLWTQLLRSPTAQHQTALAASLALLPGRGGCHFPDGVAGLATSAMHVFADHIAEHSIGSCGLRRNP